MSERNTIVCDRCGNEADGTSLDWRRVVRHPIVPSIMFQTKFSAATPNERHVDLCGVCATKLAVWLQKQ